MKIKVVIKLIRDWAFGLYKKGSFNPKKIKVGRILPPPPYLLPTPL